MEWMPVDFKVEIPIFLRDPEMYGKYFWVYTQMDSKTAGFVKPAWWNHNHFDDCFMVYITHVARMEFPTAPKIN